MDMGLAGARVIVTGAGTGIGRVVAERFVAEGAKVAICDVNADALSDLPAGITGWVCDVSDRAAVDGFVAEAVTHLGGLDCLINNAGSAGPTGPIEDISPEDWDDTLAVCLTSQFNVSRRAIPVLRASDNPAIINFSSMAGKRGFRLRTPYAAAKWGVIGLTKSLSIELGPDKIRVNAILPGLVAGDRQRRVLEAKAQRTGQSFAAVEEAAFSYTSIHDYVPPEMIADQCIFLASPRGRLISGQAIAVCGDTQMLA